MTAAPEAPVAEMGMPVAEPVAPPTVDPSPKPSVPAAPSKSPPPSKATDAPVQEEKDVMQQALDHLDDLLGPGEKLPPKLEKARAKPKDQKEKPPTPEQKAAEQKLEQKPADEQAKPQVQPAKELRQAYEGQKTRIKELESKLAKAEEAVSKPREDAEKKALLDQVTKLQESLKEREQEIKFSNYERSDEYKERYQKPYVDAWEIGQKETSELQVTDQNGGVRDATPADFDFIMSIGRERDAVDTAKAMFGDAHVVVLNHRAAVKRLNAMRYKAIEDYRKNGSERLKQEQEQQVVQGAQMRQLWEAKNKEAKEKFEWLRPKEDDPEFNELLKKGEYLADLAFSGEQLNQLPLEKRIEIHVALRNRAAGLGPALYINRKLTARVAELEKELADYKASAPAGGDGDERSPAAPAAEDWEAALDARARPGHF